MGGRRRETTGGRDGVVIIDRGARRRRVEGREGRLKGGGR